MVRVIKRKETLQSQVYSYLRDKILMGGVQPGQRLIKEKISEETGVSRSPIREAIRRLEMDGLVTVNPQGGVVVYAPTIADINYLFECRISLEPQAAMYAAKRRMNTHLEKMKRHIDKTKFAINDHIQFIEQHRDYNTFHQLVAEASMNPLLIKMITELQGLISFSRNTIIVNNPKRTESAVSEHENIYLAILNQDPERAKYNMEIHIQKDYKLYMDNRKEN